MRPLVATARPNDISENSGGFGLALGGLVIGLSHLHAPSTRAIREAPTTNPHENVNAIPNMARSSQFRSVNGGVMVAVPA